MSLRHYGYSVARSHDYFYQNDHSIGCGDWAEACEACAVRCHDCKAIIVGDRFIRNEDGEICEDCQFARAEQDRENAEYEATWSAA